MVGEEEEAVLPPFLSMHKRSHLPFKLFTNTRNKQYNSMILLVLLLLLTFKTFRLFGDVSEIICNLYVWIFNLFTSVGACVYVFLIPLYSNDTMTINKVIFYFHQLCYVVSDFAFPLDMVKAPDFYLGLVFSQSNVFSLQSFSLCFLGKGGSLLLH